MSEIITNKLTGKTAAGNVTITSEGGSATMQLQQGVAKQWAHIQGLGSPTVSDSLNVASITDVGTGNFKQNCTNNFANDDYSFTAAGREQSHFAVVQEHNTSARTTSNSHSLSGRSDSGAGVDIDGRNITVHGDLA